MDVTQISSLATGLTNLQVNSEVSTLVLKKALDNQAATVDGILQALPQLPSNPAIGRNINTTA